MTCVKLVAEDGSRIDLLIPLDTDSRLDLDAPGPWLFKATWGNDKYLGELVERGDRLLLVWSQIDGSELDEIRVEDLRRVPITVGRMLRLKSELTREEKAFTVKELTVV